MSTLLDDLKKLPLKRDTTQSKLTRKNRAQMLVLMGKQLLELGDSDLTFMSLEARHITALLDVWKVQGISSGTQINRLTALRWWARAIFKEEIIAESNVPYGFADKWQATGPSKRFLAHQKREKRKDQAKRRDKIMNTDPPPIKSPVQKQSYTMGKQKGAYIVQFVRAKHLFKIGKTTNLANRVNKVRHEYGACDLIMFIPNEKPRQVEQILHKRFAAMRIYNDAASTELFRFDTRAKQRIFERFLREYPSFQITPVCWENKGESLHTTPAPALQEALFAWQATGPREEKAGHSVLKCPASETT